MEQVTPADHAGEYIHTGTPSDRGFRRVPKGVSPVHPHSGDRPPRPSEAYTEKEVIHSGVAMGALSQQLQDIKVRTRGAGRTGVGRKCLFHERLTKPPAARGGGGALPQPPRRYWTTCLLLMDPSISRHNPSASLLGLRSGWLDFRLNPFPHTPILSVVMHPRCPLLLHPFVPVPWGAVPSIPPIPGPDLLLLFFDHEKRCNFQM